MFCTSTMTLPSALHRIHIMCCYRPTMSSMEYEIPFDDNEKENNDDDSPSPLRRPSKQERRHHVRKDLIIL